MKPPAILPYSLFSHLGEMRHGPDVSSRVAQLIREEEERSERLIGWAQLTVAMIFAALYFAAPRPLDAMSFEPVPIFLAGYILFTGARLLLTYRGFMPGWLLVVSMIVDVALLMGLIWSFHVQYGQPAAFYLKVPTFIYIFIFIALRALRFDWRFVVSIGVFAAIGWLGMVIYAVRGAGEEMITRNFIDYLTGNYVLIGAEFDKIATILIVTGVLAFALYRARRILITAVKQETAAKDIRRFLADSVAETITGADDEIHAGKAEERDAAVIMLDIRGFTTFLHNRSPSEVVALLVSFHERVIPIVRRHGGIVDKFMGDGVMATFGAVRPTETAAADAYRAFDEIMDEARIWTAAVNERENQLLYVNGAMATGKLVFATLGDDERLEYTVIGEPANLAAKLEKHNKTEQVAAITTRAALDTAVAQGFAPRGEPEIRERRDVAGVDEPIDLVVVAYWD